MRHDGEKYMITIGEEGITLWRVGQARALARKKQEKLKKLEKGERNLETAMTKNRLEQEEINRWLAVQIDSGQPQQIHRENYI